jgi:hypothetical protein
MTARTEARTLLEGCAVAVLVVAALHRSPQPTHAHHPYERAFSSLPPSAQVVAQDGLALLAEAELHAGLHTLPAWTKELVDRGLRARHLEAVQGGAQVVIAGAALLVITPVPTGSAPSVEHHRLVDGRDAHVALWMRPDQTSLHELSDSDCWVPAARGLVRIMGG